MHIACMRGNLVGAQALHKAGAAVDETAVWAALNAGGDTRGRAPLLGFLLRAGGEHYVHGARASELWAHALTNAPVDAVRVVAQRQRAHRTHAHAPAAAWRAAAERVRFDEPLLAYFPLAAPGTAVALARSWASRQLAGGADTAGSFADDSLDLAAAYGQLEASATTSLFMRVCKGAQPTLCHVWVPYRPRCSARGTCAAPCMRMRAPALSTPLTLAVCRARQPRG
jgi:hypothetical protein